MIITNHRLNILAISALALVLVTVILYGKEENRQLDFEKGVLLIQGIDLTKVAKITIKKEKETVNLVRQGDGYVVAERSNYPAAVKQVNDLLIKILDIRCAAKVTDNPKNHEDLGVKKDAPKTAAVTLWGEDGKPIVELLVGTDAEHGSGAHVRLAHQDAVYTTESYLWLSASPTGYMETKIVEVKEDETEQVTVQLKDKTYVIQRDKDKKLALQGIPAGKRAKESAVKAVFTGLSYLTFSNVVAETATKVTWDATYTCRTNKHLTYVVQVGKQDKKHYIRARVQGPSHELIEQSRQIGKTEAKDKLEKKDAVLTAADAAKTFNQKHQGWVYELSEWRAKDLRKPFADLIEAIPDDKAPKEIAASHILISYKGAERSEAKRSKAEAKKRAEEVLKKAKAPGADFAVLAKKYSDGPSKTKGGDLGTFKKGTMHKNFETAAWKLKVNEISDIVETPFGFHIIKRTK